ncbi:MAG TPA: ribonuclease E activity regulator RraA [Gaiellaceae bacterium]|nr:ribonuclease E activity regulator RraA [Gaiellaceae bacterium]
MTTSDLYDENAAVARTCETQLRSFGGVASFSGRIATVRCLEDNVLVKQRVSEPGGGRVLVVDGGGSFRCALVGGNVAGAALANGWAGLVLNCCVRDTSELAELGLGILALGTNPKPSSKTGAGEVDVPVSFGGCTFAPGETLHADGDGIVVLP